MDTSYTENQWRKLYDEIERLKTENAALKRTINFDAYQAWEETQTKLQAAEEALAMAREALENIAVYGCGMLNQPAAMNAPEEVWLKKRIQEYERVAHAALQPKENDKP